VDEALSGGAVGVAHSEDEPRSERYDEYQRDDDDNDDEADQTVTVTTTSAVAAARRRGTLRLQLDPLHTSTHTHTILPMKLTKIGCHGNVPHGSKN